MAEGDIGSVLGTLDFHPSSADAPDIIHIAGHVYAIAYFDGSSPYHGTLKTVTISDDGETLALTGSSLVWETNWGLYPTILHVSGDVYAIVYQGYNNVGKLTTVTISEDGAIGGSVIATLTWADPGSGCTGFIHVSGHVYAIACHYGLWTVTISDDGETLALTGSSLVFDPDNTRPRIIHVSGDVYAINYQGADGDGWLKTVTISEDGETLALTGSSLEWDTSRGGDPEIIHVSGHVYAIAYAYTDDSARLKTVTISDGGALALAGGSLQFDTYIHYRPSIFHISGDVYAIAYEGPDDDGWLKTVTISEDGETLALTGSSLEFDPEYGRRPDIIHVLEDVYAIPYRGSATGRLKTVDIKTVLPVVTTGAATDVEATSATLNGTLDDDGGEACDVRFQYGETSDYGIDTEWQPGKESVVAFEQDITGLSPNKTYHFRAQARNSTGTVNGADRTFATPLGLPAVTTNPATEVGQTTATLNGTLEADGGEACDCGFEYGETTDYGSTTATQSKTTGETFSREVLGLRPGGILYHFRAIATNSVGTDRGDDQTFRTSALSAEAHQALGRHHSLGRHGL